jgi:restriction endonuclease Mrr
MPSSRTLVHARFESRRARDVISLRETIAKKFEISNEDRKKLSKNKRPLFETRIIHSSTLLRKNGFIVNQKRANFKITKSGLNKLKNL